MKLNFLIKILARFRLLISHIINKIGKQKEKFNLVLQIQLKECSEHIIFPITQKGNIII